MSLTSITDAPTTRDESIHNAFPKDNPLYRPVAIPESVRNVNLTEKPLLERVARLENIIEKMDADYQRRFQALGIAVDKLSCTVGIDK